VHYDFERIPVHYRFRLGTPSGSILTGPHRDPSGMTYMTIVTESEARFERFDLVCGAPYTASEQLPRPSLWSPIIPQSADLIVDLEFSPDQGTTWSSIFPAGQPLPSLPIGRDAALLSFATATFPFGTYLRANIVQVDSFTYNVLFTAYGTAIAD
jgi:hypothetical protein